MDMTYWQATQQLIRAVQACETGGWLSILETMAPGRVAEMRAALAVLTDPQTIATQHAQLVRQVCDTLADLSEEQYCAGWLTGVEHDVWDQIQSQTEDGTFHLDPETIAELRSYAAAIGGWVAYAYEPTWCPVFVPATEWETRHAAWNVAMAEERRKTQAYLAERAAAGDPVRNIFGEVIVFTEPT